MSGSKNTKKKTIINKNNSKKNKRPIKRKSLQNTIEYPIDIKKSNINTPAIKYEDDRVTYFVVNKIIPKLKIQMKKIGKLNITTNSIGIGELLFHEYATAKGKYIIYDYNGCLIAIHENESIGEQIFTITNYSANCDIGMFSYNDIGYVKKYMKKENFKKKSSFIGMSFPAFDTSILISSKGVHYSYVYESDLDINKNNSEANNEDPIAIFANNNYGDGSFPIYRGRNAFWIMSDNTWLRMLELISRKKCVFD